MVSAREQRVGSGEGARGRAPLSFQIEERDAGFGS
jgi:hypothetical protein